MTTWIDLKSIRLSEISQMEKDKHRMISLHHMTQNLKMKQKKQKQTCKWENKLVVARGERDKEMGKMGGEGW